MFNQSGLFFVPKRWQSISFLRWLKRVHAWTGFWGATLFFVLGISGFLLNHRSIMKIDTGEPVEASTVQIPVTAGVITDTDSLGRWAKNALGLPVKPKAPNNSSPAKAGDVRFNGRDVKTAETWTQTFAMPNARVTVSYVPGANFVSAKREAAGLLGTIKNMHKGSGLSIAWVLLLDTIAGALITMSLTGFLLWTRMHGTRLLAGALVGGSLVWAAAATVPSMG
ncbi:MAG: PepSY-associated TM helix domain-containing protein [Pseudomonadota bacterium]